MSQPVADELELPEAANGGMSSRAARQAEYAIIALGVLALALIFQPFSLSLFGIGCALVVVAGLINNLLPLCQPGTRPRTLVRAAIVIPLIFCVVLLISLTAAYLYGVLFVIAFAPDDSTPFYEQPFVWAVAATGVVLAAAVAMLGPSKPDPS
jgi:hypothetical protein